MKNKRLTALIALMTVLALLLTACGAAVPAAETGEPAQAPASEPAPTSSQPSAGSDGIIRVSTADELIAAIAPDTTIQIVGVDEIRLDKAKSYGSATGNDYCTWNDTVEGYELVISKVNGLTILGEDNSNVYLLTSPRYANVLSFKKCDDLTLRDLTLGHTEGGICSGGVLMLDSVQNALIDDCRLFGCGTTGIFAEGCRSVTVRDTTIDDCSDAAAYAFNTRELLFDNCDINYIADGYSALFNFAACMDCAVVNCEISNNKSNRLIYSENSANVSLLGCEVENNVFFNGMLWSCGYSLIVDDCGFSGNRFENDWYCASSQGYGISELAIDTAGNILNPPLLEKMTHSQVTFDFAAIQSLTAPPADGSQPAGEKPKTAEDGTTPAMGGSSALNPITVTTVDELLAAIAPGANIILADGDYFLDSAASYGSYGGLWYRWEQEYDGPQLVISNVDNLTITGSDAAKVTIAAYPRYADVISFNDCDDLTIKGITLGHTEEPGECSGGVLYFSDCDDVRIDSCALFGCGTIGLFAYDCEDFIVDSTEIYDCSIRSVSLSDCEDFTFTNCSIHDNGDDEFHLIGCKNVTLDGRKVKNDSW